QVARESAKAMSKVIEDQLVETRWKDVSIKAQHSAHLYGTGIVKGPLVERKIRTRFVKTKGKWITKSEEYLAPFVDYVPIWRFYPDMNATELSQCQFVYERHQMTKAAVLELAKRKSFKKQVIVDYVKARPEGEVVVRYYDNELSSLGERDANQRVRNGQY